MRKQPACPECEKLHAVSEGSQEIGEFLEWLTRKVYFCELDGEEFVRHNYDYQSTNQILAEYYKIDLDKVEHERRELLKWLREVQA